MKMTLFRNYYLLIIAWSLYLNDCEFSAFAIGLIAIAYLIGEKSEVNKWRVIAISLLIYMISLSVLYASNIPYFFPSLKYFLLVTSIDYALSNEYLCEINSKFIFPVLIMISLFVCGLFLVIYLLPERLYTMFTKRSIYLMALFIFLPSLALMACACFIQNKAVLLKKWRYSLH